MTAPFRLILAIALILAAPARAQDRQQISIPAIKSPVEVVFDRFGIPHIYGQSAEDAYAALGYLHARDRLLQMEMMRRRAAGRLAEVLGPDEVRSDIEMRKLGIRRFSEETVKSGLLGADVVRWLEAYAAGVNARLAEIGDNGKPALLKFMGVKLDPWSPVDSVSFIKYMGWDQGGTDADLWLGTMVDSLGAEVVDELWPLDRPYEVPIAPTWPPDLTAAKSAANHLDSGPSDDMLALARRGLRIAPADCAAMMDRVMAASSPRGDWTIGSNNWVISGAKSATGKPILCNDPHLGFSIPSVWYTAHVVAPGLNVSGVTFPGGPFVVIGHNDRIAWGMTNMQADAVDYFIETINPDNPKQYKHRGEWKTLKERKETIGVKGEVPREVVIESTVHGPIDRAGDRVIALQWTGLKPTQETRGIAQINRAQGLKDFLQAIRYQDVPALNLVYADVEGDIAIACAGELPIRARGKGRVPVDGASGEFNWIGRIPKSELPISINPERGWLASANGRPHALGYPHHLGWMWDPSYRSRRINDLLAAGHKITFEQMQAFQFDAHDKAAEVFIPVLIDAFDRDFYGGATEKRAIEMLRSWKFLCEPSSPAPTIYAKWLEVYRGMVWNDEWKSRGIQQPGGSWGFCGENRREPAFEVLEQITRENPDSIWFDDRATPERETRDDILKASFQSALAELAKQMGAEPSAWVWGNLNKLHIHALVPSPQLDRGGMPVFGGPFTLNPGGWLGHVGGGASWRQVVDLGAIEKSVGVYPGGQSDDPKSKHYDDQIEPWTKGQYAPMIFHARAEDFAADEVESRATFAPGEARGEASAENPPAAARSTSDQVEFTSPTPLLGADGNLKAWGWARRAQMTYNRDAVPTELRARLKEWEHYTIMSPDFTIGLTIAQLGPIAFGSFEVIEYPGGVKPGGFFSKMGSKDVSVFPSNPYGKTTLAAMGNSMTLAHEGTKRKFTFSFAATKAAPAISGEIELDDDPKTDSVAIARPFAEPGHFFYENKIFGMPARGSATVGEKTYSFPDGNSWAIFDWGRGVWPRECSWFWGQAAGMAGGKRVAFNLGHGYGDDAKGTCNAILFEGKLHKLETVKLEFDENDRMKPWKITSTDGRLTLDFKPIYHQHAKQQILVAATELHKIHGRFSGTLTLDDGTKVEVKDLLGFMEHAQHQW